jgi:ABC-type Fe3+ transport system substrate-binding protein
MTRHVLNICQKIGLVIGLLSGLSSTATFADDHIFKPLSPQSERLVIYSSTDMERIRPVILAFQKKYPTTTVEYEKLSSVEIFDRVARETDGGDFTADIAFGPAMDLQFKLVNDGYVQPYQLSVKGKLPDWANWRNKALGMTYEPAVMIYNRKLAPEMEKVSTRYDLATLVLKNKLRYHDKIATYDPAKSGTGYLFATQDEIHAEDYWYLARSLGTGGARQLTKSADMVDLVAKGELLMAYNVLGSHANARAIKDPNLAILLFEDYTLITSRIAVILRKARNPVLAGQFIKFLLSAEGQGVIAGPASLYSQRTDIPGEATAGKLQAAANGPLMHIHLGPGLLVYQDRLKRKDFMRRWTRAMHDHEDH